MSPLEQTIIFPWNIYKNSFQKNRQVCGERLAISERPLEWLQRRGGGARCSLAPGSLPAVSRQTAGDQSLHQERSLTLLIKGFRQVWEWHAPLGRQQGAEFPSSRPRLQKDIFTSGGKKSTAVNKTEAEQIRSGKSWNMINSILLFIKIIDPGGNFDLRFGDGIRTRYREDVGNPFESREYKSAHFPTIVNVFVRSESEGFDQEVTVAAISVHEKALREVQRRQSCCCFSERHQRLD